MGNMFSLAGKAAMVTGAGRPTGLCYGMALALKEAGAKVVLCDITDGVFELRDYMGGEAEGVYAVKANLCDAASLPAVFDEAVKLAGGRIDILLNGAGIQFRSPVLEFPIEKWDAVIDVNLNSMFYISQVAAKHMAEMGGGKIINIASMTSFVASQNIVAYAASKGGVMQLTKALSNELAAKGICVNAIAPGYMATQLTADMQQTEQGKRHTARIAMGRWGKPEDLGGPVVFLASEASDYITGAIIPVDGGYLSM